MTILNVFCFGNRLQRYREFIHVQKRLNEWRKASKIPDTVLTLQYYPVYTIGKRGKPSHFLRSQEELRSEGFDIESIDRGGEVTYHGPGQIIIYPIMDLRSKNLGPRRFVENLENVMIQFSSLYGLSAEGQIPGKTGVWIGPKKIGAIGVRISGGISSHGIAYNVNVDFNHYQNIIPCGFSNKDITDLRREFKGELESLENIERKFVNCFQKAFDYENVTFRSLTDFSLFSSHPL